MEIEIKQEIIEALRRMTFKSVGSNIHVVTDNNSRYSWIGLEEMGLVYKTKNENNPLNCLTDYALYIMNNKDFFKQ